jgi:hypothetical protein
MSNRLRLRFRAIVAALAGAALLLVSVNSEFLRSHFEAWTTLVNLFIALFGAAFFVQSYLLVKQIPATESE